MTSPYSMTTPPANRAALLTPAGRGAVASLQIDGPQSAEFIARHFRRPNASLALRRVYVGHWNASSTAAVKLGISEEVVVCQIAPQRFEVHCHGGSAASQRILADLEHDGCRILSWRDWFAAVEPSPIRAAAMSLLAEARTERTALVLLDQYQGALDRAIAEIHSAILGAAESQRGELALGRIDALFGRAPLGLHLIEPWRVVLAGAPNAGKSSLVNALVGYRRSIVHERPGTTRDAVSVATSLDGWPIELIDTAGLRASDDALESAGIVRAREQAAAADLVLLVIDVTAASSADPPTLSASQTSKRILVYNKIDLLEPRNGFAAEYAGGERLVGVAVSAVTGAGLDSLIGEIVMRCVGNPPTVGAAVPFLASQIESLGRARRHVSQSNWIAAAGALAAMLEQAGR